MEGSSDSCRAGGLITQSAVIQVSGTSDADDDRTSEWCRSSQSTINGHGHDDKTSARCRSSQSTINGHGQG
ncbi:hypothetical protein RRG08_026354 [Elysia crispata]|uniref:Uncharacterized protein n=1 Tax=Elysia crispata TaxID=231223 RepID=A0AAE1CJD0_9GAST|nr:hypothetical protein RRG08_026354 [Elysia crispata]